MLTHDRLWTALDKFAAKHGLSPSGLARAAGLDPTTFNKSKRGRDGQLRWPSTESLAKVLEATGTTLREFATMAGDDRDGDNAERHKLPLLGLDAANATGCFDPRGFPAGPGWKEAESGAPFGSHAYMLEISGDDLLPVYRDGDRILVSPEANMKRGDRVIARTRKGDMHVRQLGRMTTKRIELRPLHGSSREITFELGDLAFLHRIVWASQ